MVHRVGNDRSMKPLLRWLAALLLGAPQAFAGAVFSFVPLTPTTLTLPVNATTQVRYQVTNQTQVTRTLDVTPVAGVHPNIGVGGACGDPFTLAPGQSCVLVLDLVGSEIGTGVQGGPTVCVVGSAFNCFQPTAADQLNVVITSLLLFDDGFESGTNTR